MDYKIVFYSAQKTSVCERTLKKCLSAYGIAWKDRVSYLCTVQIGRKIHPEISHRLNEMCRYYQIELDHHKADSDSVACEKIFIECVKRGMDPQDFIKIFEIN